jgi:hypothetical protein
VAFAVNVEQSAEKNLRGRCASWSRFARSVAVEAALDFGTYGAGKYLSNKIWYGTISEGVSRADRRVAGEYVEGLLTSAGVIASGGKSGYESSQHC